VSRELREAIADWLMLVGALLLVVSLFCTWSHQFSPAFATQWRGAVPLRGVARDPTGWQVYSIADVALALVAAILVLVSFVGTRRARLAALVPVALGLAFVVHALSVPPTHGVELLAAAATTNHPTSGFGETLALVALATAVIGLTLSFTAD
jgi:hypothetical protein